MKANNHRIDVFGMTDVGNDREANEDQFLVADLGKSMLIHQSSLKEHDHELLLGESQGTLLVVADGMGGHGGGDVASSVAVDTITGYVLNIMPWFFGLDVSHEDDLRDELKSALERSHKRVLDAARADDEHPTMGTTLTMAYVIWPRLFIVHVGDSRCYLYREPTLEQITRDHTLAQKLVDDDVIPPERAAESRWSDTLWNAIGGGSEELAPEVYRAVLHPGDTLLLCTDGVTKHLDDGMIADRLSVTKRSSEDAARDIVERAKNNGGTDNITAIIAQFH